MVKTLIWYNVSSAGGFIWGLFRGEGEMANGVDERKILSIYQRNLNNVERKWNWSGISWRFEGRDLRWMSGVLLMGCWRQLERFLELRLSYTRFRFVREPSKFFRRRQESLRNLEGLLQSFEVFSNWDPTINLTYKPTSLSNTPHRFSIHTSRLLLFMHLQDNLDKLDEPHPHLTIMYTDNFNRRRLIALRNNVANPRTFWDFYENCMQLQISALNFSHESAVEKTLIFPLK
jgi:hypothetical protein